MSKPLVLIADKLSPATVEELGNAVEVQWVNGPNKEELLAAVPGADALLVRSGTTVDADVIAAAKNLKIIARAGVGIDNVDVQAATAHGVMVVNAPTSNVHSAAEHAVALLLATARQIPLADASLKAHTWKRNSFSGVELLGKTVGVVGLGRIGQLVAQRLTAFETHIIAYDPYVSHARAAQLGIELADLDTLLEKSDFITIHLPKTAETAGLIGPEQLAKVKPGVIIVNAARGGLVDEKALVAALESGRVRGAGFDVFAVEPVESNPLCDLENVVVTPHIAASTAEAQDRAGIDVARSVRKALAGEFVAEAVNISGGQASEEVLPWIDLTRKLGVLVGALSRENGNSDFTNVQVNINGELASHSAEVLSLAALSGIFNAISQEQVTFVNAPALAAVHGVTASVSTNPHSPTHRSIVDVVAVFSNGTTINVAGSLTGLDLVQKIVNLNGRNFDLRAQGHNLIVGYEDKPGSLGIVGTAIGAAGINIQAAAVSQDAGGDGATIIVRLEKPIPAEVVRDIEQKLEATLITQVDLT